MTLQVLHFRFHTHQYTLWRHKEILRTTVLLSSASVCISPVCSSFCAKVGGENFVVPLHELLIGSILKTKYSPGTPRSGAIPYVP